MRAITVCRRSAPSVSPRNHKTMSVLSPTRRISLLLFGALLTGCQVTSAPGEPAEVDVARYTLTEAAGGHVSQLTVLVNFGSDSYTISRCAGSVSTVCAATSVPSQGVLSAADKDRLVQRIGSSSFSRLRGNYPLSGAPPPDGAAGSLTVTTDAGEQTVNWDRRGTYPAILAEVECRLLQLAGWLILCAN